MLLSVSKCNDFHNPNSVTNCLSLISIAFYSYYLYFKRLILHPGVTTCLTVPATCVSHSHSLTFLHETHVMDGCIERCKWRRK